MSTMRREQFLESRELQIQLLTAEKKFTQLRQRYVIEVVTDRRIEQVRKTFREFQYFNKLLHKRLGLRDKQLKLSKHFRSANDYADLDYYIKRINSGYLTYRTPEQAQKGPSLKGDTSEVLMLESIKTKELRGYLYDLLFRQDELFVDGVDDESEDSDVQDDIEQSAPLGRKAQINKQLLLQGQKKEAKSRSKSKSDGLFQRLSLTQNNHTIGKLISSTVPEGAVEAFERAQIGANVVRQSMRDAPVARNKSSEPGSLRRAIKNLAQKARKAGHRAAHFYESIPETKNLRSVLKNIKRCWIKYPNNYRQRDRSVIYKPYTWQQYEIRLQGNQIQLSNATNGHKHRKIIVIFQSEVELNFEHYTKLIVRNTIDKNPLEIRLSLDEDNEQITEHYLALYTYIKQAVQEQEAKLQAVSPLETMNRVCNKVRIRISLKQKLSSPNSLEATKPGAYEGKDPIVVVNLPHAQTHNNQKERFESRPIKDVASNVKIVSIKITHVSIEAAVTIGIESYVDVDFPIVDNFGFLDIVVDETGKQPGFLPIISAKDPLYAFHLPVQTIYDYMYNQDVPRARQNELKAKMIEVKHTKLNLSLDYKCIGNYRAYCAYNQNDIFEQDEPPKEFNRDELRMHNNRLKRIVWSVQLYLERVKDLLNFTYPNLSYCFYLFVALACLFYDNNGFLFYFLVLLLSVLFYNSPVYEVYVKDFVEILKLQAKKKNLDTFLFRKNKHIEEEYVWSTKKQAKLQFLKQFQLTRKNKASIYRKYKRILQVLFKAQVLLTKFVTFIEKTKNVFLWYHYHKTRLLFCIVGIAVICLMVLPVRLLLCLLVVRQMSKGAKYHGRTQDMNKVIIINLIGIIIRENSLEYMNGFYKEYYRPLDTKNPQTAAFFKTCLDSLSDWLQVKINMEEVIRKSKHMADVFENLSKCKTKFEIRKEICQKYSMGLEWSKTKSSFKPVLEMVYGFIVTVPSDKYVMGVKTVSGGNQQQVDEVDNIIDRELLNF